jgi:hypothetical protein
LESDSVLAKEMAVDLTKMAGATKAKMPRLEL